MAKRFPGSVISATPVTPNLTTTSGVWAKEQHIQAAMQSIWPLDAAAADPYFKNVSLLLHGDGTNGAQNSTFLNTPPPGASPYAAYLPGSASYMSIPNTSTLDFGTGDFTIEFWMYAVSMPNVAGIVGKKTGDSSNGWQVYHNAENANGKMSIRLTLQIDFASASNWKLNTWEHWAITRSGSTLRWFKNGVLDATGSSSANLTDNTLTYIGYSQTWGGYFTGYLSNLRIVKGTALYTSNFAPSTSPLTAVSGTTLLTFQNATLVDNSSSVQAITASGSATIVNSNVVPAITRNGNTTQGSFSPFGTLWSNYFDGSGDYLSAPYSTSAFDWWSGNYTLEAWVFPTSYTGWYYADGILSRGTIAGNHTFNSTVNYWSIGLNSSGNLIFGYYNGSAQVSASSQAASLNTWNHIALVVNNSSITLYVNGVGTSIGSISGTPQSSSGTPLTIGAGNSAYVNGYISNLRIVKGTAVYTSNFTPSTTPLTAISGTTLLTCQSNRFVDSSATAATITRNGDVAISRFSPFSPTAAYDASVIGGSAYFDGTGDYLTGSGSTAFTFGTSAFTVEYWVMQSASTGTYAQHCGTSSTSSGFGFGLNGSTVYMTTSAVGYYASLSLPFGVWNHIAWTRDSSNMVRAFLNGVLCYGPTSVTTNITETGFGIGATPSGTYAMASGYISNLRVIKGTALYTGAFTPPTAPLTAVANTSLLLSMTNGAIFDNAMRCDLETLGNVQISTSVKKYGTGSIAFDGTGDYLSTPANTIFDFGAGDFTIEAWVYPTSVSSDWFICSGIGSGGFFFGNSAGVGFGWGRNAVAWDYRSGILVTNAWSHVAVSRSGTSMRVFINGVQQGTTQTNSTSYNLSTGGTSIGSQGANYYLNGYIDDLRITKGVARYTANFTPPVVTNNR